MQFELTISNKQAEVTHLLTFLKKIHRTLQWHRLY